MKNPPGDLQEEMKTRDDKINASSPEENMERLDILPTVTNNNQGMNCNLIDIAIHKRQELKNNLSSEGFDEKIIEEVGNIPDNIILEIKLPRFFKNIKRRSSCSPKGFITLYWNSNDFMGSPPVFHHEYGHHVHFAKGIMRKKSFGKACDDTLENLDARLGKDWGDKWKNVLRGCHKFAYTRQFEIMDLPDDIGSRCRVEFYISTIRYILSRGGEYCSRSGRLRFKREIFANCYVAKIMGWNEFDYVFAEIMEELNLSLACEKTRSKEICT